MVSGPRRPRCSRSTERAAAAARPSRSLIARHRMRAQACARRSRAARHRSATRDRRSSCRVSDGPAPQRQACHRRHQSALVVQHLEALQPRATAPQQSHRKCSRRRCGGGISRGGGAHRAGSTTCGRLDLGSRRQAQQLQLPPPRQCEEGRRTDRGGRRAAAVREELLSPAIPPCESGRDRRGSVGPRRRTGVGSQGGSGEPEQQLHFWHEPDEEGDLHRSEGDGKDRGEGWGEGADEVWELGCAKANGLMGRAPWRWRGRPRCQRSPRPKQSPSCRLHSPLPLPRPHLEWPMARGREGSVGRWMRRLRARVRAVPRRLLRAWFEAAHRRAIPAARRTDTDETPYA